MEPLGPCLPLPTRYKRNIRFDDDYKIMMRDKTGNTYDVDRDQFVLNARDGFIAAAAHPCGKLYNLAKSTYENLISP